MSHKINDRQSYLLGRRAERHRITNLIEQFRRMETLGALDDLFDDMHRFIKEGKTEYLKNFKRG